MNIQSERDGLEMANERGTWTLYLVEDDGTKYTALATLHDHECVRLLSAYLSLGPRKPGNDNRVIPFPEKRHPRCLGIRVRPSTRLLDHFEVPAFESGQWRATSVHSTRTDADALAERLVEKAMLQRMEQAGGGELPPF